jgi:hypothetical protein
VGEHGGAVAQDEGGAVAGRRRGSGAPSSSARAPAQELDLLGAHASLRTTAVVPSYSSRRSLMMSRAPPAPGHRACAGRAWGAGCTASPRSGGRTPGWPRSSRGVSSGLPTIRPPTTYIPLRVQGSMACTVALPALRPPSRRSFLALAFRKPRSSSEARSRCRGRRSGSRPSS